MTKLVTELELKEDKESKIRAKEEREAKEKSDRIEAFVDHIRFLPQKMYEEDIDGEIINQVFDILKRVQKDKVDFRDPCRTNFSRFAPSRRTKSNFLDVA